MRTTITIPDELFTQLMQYTKSESRTKAVHVAVESYIKRAKIEQLRALRGKLDVAGTETSDEADMNAQHERLDV